MIPKCVLVIPEDYRLLRRGETVRKGDLFQGTWADPLDEWDPVNSTIGRRVWSTKGSIYMGCGDYVVIIRPVEEPPEWRAYYAMLREMTKKELAAKKALARANTARWAKRARELKRMHRKDRALLQLSYLT
jgi:hypothetical protein